MEKDLLSQLLQLISDNKKFPKYQTERRIDIFINYFLKEVLEAKYGKIIDIIIPELPLKKPDSNRSTNLDYFVASNKSDIGYLIELKTDYFSVNHEQIERYLLAQSQGFNKIKIDIECISNTTHRKYREKYQYLTEKLKQISQSIDLIIIYFGPRKCYSEIEKYIGDKFWFIALEDLKLIQIEGIKSIDWDTFKQKLDFN